MLLEVALVNVLLNELWWRWWWRRR